MTDRTFSSLFDGKQYEFEKKVEVHQPLLAKLERYKIINRVQRQEIQVHFVTVYKL